MLHQAEVMLPWKCRGREAISRREKPMPTDAQQPPGPFDPVRESVPGGWDQLAHAGMKPGKPGVRGGKIEDFLQEVYGLAGLNDIESATDRIFDTIDRLLCDGAFTVCDEILQ